MSAAPCKTTSQAASGSDCSLSLAGSIGSGSDASDASSDADAAVDNALDCVGLDLACAVADGWDDAEDDDPTFGLMGALDGHRFIIDGGGLREPGDDEMRLLRVLEDVERGLCGATRSDASGMMSVIQLASLSVDPDGLPSAATVAKIVRGYREGKEPDLLPERAFMPPPGVPRPA